MKMRFVVTACLVIAAAGAAVAQTPATHPTAPTIDARTPGDCTKPLNDWRNAQVAPAFAALRQATAETRDEALARYSALSTAVSNETIRAAKECGAKFSVETTPSAQLIELVALYTFTRDTTNRRRATERVLAATDLPPRQHAQSLVLAMNEEITRASSYFGIIDGAERVVSRIDALPDSLADVKLSAHQTMLGRYEYLDVDDGLRTHALAVLDLGRRLGKPDAMVSAYVSLARSSADQLHPDSALKILDHAEQELGTGKVGQRFADFRNRYALIGTKAAPITGHWWLNAQGEATTVQPGDGKVRFVEFTAHWCGPCKNSYPGVRSLAERFQGKPFEGVLVTSTYGFIGDQKNLTPEQEVAADRTYFTQEHQLPYKVAVNPPSKNEKGMSIGQPLVDVLYRVGGIPQIMIIDKRGFIRQIVTGWDQGNTQRIGNLIEQLLKEPVT